MEQIFFDLLEAIDDPNREGLLKTPKRASEAFKFLTSGYHQNVDNLVNDAVFETRSSGMVIVKNIEFYSLCEHHLLPFFGECTIGYLPRKNVLGLSKFARIVDMCARKLQIQENLTFEIAQILMKILDPRGVSVFMEAKHLCMMMRGVSKQSSLMQTSQMLGVFESDSMARLEVMNLMKESS